MRLLVQAEVLEAEGWHFFAVWADGPETPITRMLETSPSRGLVKVVGPDVFRLDADHDGWGCESD